MKEGSYEPRSVVKLGKHFYWKGLGPRKENAPWDQVPKRRELHEGVKEETKQALRSRVKGTPSVLFILAGPNRYDEKRGRYVAASFKEGDERSAMILQREDIVTALMERGITREEIEEAKKSGLPSGANDRIAAAAALHAAFPEVDIVSVTRPTDRPKEPTYASVAAEGLRQRGVAEKRIRTEMEDARAVNTITEFKEAARLWKEHGWKSIPFITAEWHVPRAMALLNHIEDFADDGESALITEFAKAIRTGQLSVQFLDTTKVLVTRSSKFAAVFKKVEESPGMKIRRILEENAVAQIAQGTYGDKVLTHKIWPDEP